MFERNEKYDFSAYLTSQNQVSNVIAQQIIPTPRVSEFSQTQTLDISQELNINYSGIDKTHLSAATQRLALLGINISDDAAAIKVTFNSVT